MHATSTRRPWTRREVVLSFDDGPDPVNTPKLLDVLGKRRIRAVFFLSGHNLSTPSGKAVLNRIRSEGHYIGNHAYTHPDMTQLSEEKIREELRRTAVLIGDADQGIKLFRPPYGYHNELVERVAGEFGYQIVFWNVDTLDWDPRFKPDGWVRHGLNQIRKRQHSFVLAHDIHSTTVANLDKFITAVLAKPDTRFPVESDVIERHIASACCLPEAEVSPFVRARRVAGYPLRFIRAQLRGRKHA